jgi:hypothetical protein
MSVSLTNSFSIDRMPPHAGAIMWVINAPGPNGNFITHIITHIERWLWVVWGGQRRTAEVSA